MSGDLVAFLRTRLAEGIEQARESGNMLITHGAPRLGIPASVAEGRARLIMHEAEVRQQFFDETVRPYLGTAGPAGRLAERQMRLLAWEYLGHPEYREEWRP